MTRQALTFFLLFHPLLAQNVPPPPRPDAVDPALAPILDSLKQTLLTSGKLDYTFNGTSFRFGTTGVSAVPSDCRMRVDYFDSLSDEPPQPLSHSFFFESIDTAEAMTMQVAREQYQARAGDPNPKRYKYSAGFMVLINGDLTELRFPQEETAKQAANLIRRASGICRAVPVQTNAAAQGPGITETLRFIEQKLNEEATASFLSTSLNDSDNFYNASHRVQRAIGDPAACQIQYANSSQSSFPGGEGYFYSTLDVISFRRVRQLEVVDERDQQKTSVVSPTVYSLRIHSLGDQVESIVYFLDEEMANRVAKAMRHAIELCGGGSKDPF